MRNYIGTFKAFFKELTIEEQTKYICVGMCTFMTDVLDFLKVDKKTVYQSITMSEVTAFATWAVELVAKRLTEVKK